MKITDADPGSMLLCVMRDGSPGTGERQLCALCRKPMVEFVASPGLRKKAPAIKDRVVTCVNTDWVMGAPCPGALRAKPVLDGLAAAVSK